MKDLARPDPTKDIAEPDLTILTEYMLEIMKGLMGADTARELRKLIAESRPAYESVRQFAVNVAIGRALVEKLSLEQQVLDGVGSIWDSLAQSDVGLLTQGDKRILLDWLQELNRLTGMLPKVPPENQPMMLRALLDGFWSLLGAELAALTAMLVSTGQLEPKNPRAAHWLCLEVRRYLKEWRSALFANDPELRRRLAAPSETLTTEEMEQRFGV